MTTSTEPDFLYHYTSQEGLLGILKNNKLWMTNILYLNDSSEFTHTLDLVKTELKNRCKSPLCSTMLNPSNTEELLNPEWEMMTPKTRKYEVYKNLISFFDSHYFGVGDSVYVFSLSTERNDLNQWRGYCPKEGGFCIEFETKKISSLVKKTNRSLIKCIYNRGEKDKIIKSKFDELEFLFDSNSKTRSIFDDFNTKVVNQKIVDEGIIEFFHHKEIMDISSYMKDESFKKEKEYRIVHKLGSIEIKYRQGNSTIVPYIEVNLSDNDSKLPISKIIVGPTPHPELSKLSVQGLLKSEKYEDVEVEISEIPYRSW